MGSGASRPQVRTQGSVVEPVYVAILAAEEDKAVAQIVVETLQARNVKTELITGVYNCMRPCVSLLW